MENTKSSKLLIVRYYAAIFIINAISMMLELVAQRVISPYFGNSYFVWTAIIGIILLSGSAGNMIGGRISKQNNALDKLRKIMFGGAVYILLIPTFAPVFLQLLLVNLISAPNYVKIGSIVSSIILFFIPATILGVITPVLMGEMLKGHEDLGNESGKIHADAALGSLVGTFVGGFILISLLGTRILLLLLGILILGCIFLIPASKKDNISMLSLSIAVIVAIVYLFHGNAAAEHETLNEVASIDTQYGRIVINDTKNDKGEPVRLYRQSGGFSSATFLEEDKKYELVFDYAKAYTKVTDADNIKDALMIGGAAYQFPKYYISHYPDKAMDVVEIDPEAVNIAKKYFFLGDLMEDYNTEETGRLNCITADGRVYLSQTDKKYDVVLNDAFSGGNPVGILSTKEAVQAIHDVLSEDGIYAANIIGMSNKTKATFLDSEVKTMQAVFPYVYVLPSTDDYDLYSLSNFIVVGSDHPINYPDAIADYQVPECALLLTDDYCPVETLAIYD